MLLNDFYKITNIHTAEKHSISIELNPKHKIYEGHFPGNPIAPGVCLMQMVKETVEHITTKQLTLVTGNNLKFTAILNPEVNPNVNMTLSLKDRENDLIQADALIFKDETSFFSFKGTFKENFV